jgi:hypothetical protein
MFSRQHRSLHSDMAVPKADLRRALIATNCSLKVAQDKVMTRTFDSTGRDRISTEQDWQVGAPGRRIDGGFMHTAPDPRRHSKRDGWHSALPREMALGVSRRPAMRTKSFQRSAWLGLVFIMAGMMSNNATAGPPDAISGKAPSIGSTVALRLKGAIDGLLETVGLRKAPERARLRSGSEGPEFGPLD